MGKWDWTKQLEDLRAIERETNEQASTKHESKRLLKTARQAKWRASHREAYNAYQRDLMHKRSLTNKAHVSP